MQQKPLGVGGAGHWQSGILVYDWCSCELSVALPHGGKLRMWQGRQQAQLASNEQPLQSARQPVVGCTSTQRLCGLFGKLGWEAFNA